MIFQMIFQMDLFPEVDFRCVLYYQYPEFRKLLFPACPLINFICQSGRYPLNYEAVIYGAKIIVSGKIKSKEKLI